MQIQLRLLWIVWRATWPIWTTHLLFSGALLYTTRGTLLTIWSEVLSERYSSAAATPLFLGFIGLSSGLVAILLCSCWWRLIRNGTSFLLPGAESAAQLAGLIQVALLWGVTTGLNFLIVMAEMRDYGYRSTDWSWMFASAGLAAAGVGAGLLVVFGTLRLWLRAAVFLSAWVCMPALVYWAAQSASSFTFLVMLIANLALGCSLLAWALRQVWGQLFVQRRPWSVWNPQDTSSETRQIVGNRVSLPLRVDGWQHLWLSEPHGMERRWFLPLQIIGLTVAAVLSKAMTKSPEPGYAMLVMLFIVSALSVTETGLWASPRLATLPGGLDRSNGFNHLLGQHFKRSWQHVATGIGVAAAYLLLWSPSWQELLAFALIGFTVTGLNITTSLALLPVVRSSMALGVLRYLITVLTLGLVVAAHTNDWLVPGTDAWAWPLRAASLAAVACLLGAVMVQIGQRAWSRVDWANQPNTPTSIKEAKQFVGGSG